MSKWHLVVIILALSHVNLDAHLGKGHSAPTYRVSSPRQVETGSKKLQLEVLDSETGKPVPARFSLLIDGKEFIPSFLGANGLRFESIHQGKSQLFVATYSRGKGPVSIPLPQDAEQGIVHVTKGYEYLVEEIPFEVRSETTQVVAKMDRWTNLRQKGWLPADGHIHFERSQPTYDKDWLTMMDADDLTHAHFLVLKGGNLPGIWAEQFAYGKQGEGADDERLIRPGEEYRDSSQGHINLLGVEEIVEPISTGGIGEPAIPFNYPPLLEVLLQARKLGGIGGPAHGTALGGSPTGIIDTILGAVDFFEIANTHLHFVDVWYRLMNCGYDIPPAGGTDLPNYPHRDPWQPLLGETRMYVRMSERRDFDSWKAALREGEVFVSSGPMIELTVNGVGPGGTVHLPIGGGTVMVKARLSSPLGLNHFEVICNGQPTLLDSKPAAEGPVQHLVIEQGLTIAESSWLAARGYGRDKIALRKNTEFEQKAFAHTAAVRVLVGGRRILVEEDANWIVSRLKRQKVFYEKKGKYQKPADRNHILQLFDQAIDEIERHQSKSDL